jgi:dTDP-4-amino-4,6-dideoxygalactose transaminase/lipopolysaccharide/colanic/teichoic acid biosynthesis glycosyltransferase
MGPIQIAGWRPEQAGSFVSRFNRIVKRALDLAVATIALTLLCPLIIVAILGARRSTGGSGIFRQARIGRKGRIFSIYKIRTMREVAGVTTTVTTDSDRRITRFGRVLRRWKIDELPQLFNVVRGEMSLVGPRPDVPEYLDRIRREAPLVLTVRPGLTGPASIKYRREEQLLARERDPQDYNDRVIFPDKLRINEAYARDFRFLRDLLYLWQTVWPFAAADPYTSEHVGDNASKPPEMHLSSPAPVAFPSWPVCADDECDAALGVLQSGRLNYWTGQEGRHFEREFAEAVGCAHAVAVANGTVALELALWALGIGPGDEVIVPCRTFIATASAVVRCGAQPAFADVDRQSQNITAETIRARLTPRTKALIAVHLAGWPCDMDPIMALAKQHGLHVVEDCAQAHGARYRGRCVGAIGDVGAYSFCQDKIMTTAGEGGMLVTNRHDLWQRAWSFKDHGKSFNAVYNRQHAPGFRWLHEMIGTNWRLTEVQSAIGRIALRKLESWVETRRRNAAILNECLAELSGVRVMLPPCHVRHSYYKYYVFVRPEAVAPGWNRDRILNEITSAGVPCGSGSCSEIYREKAFNPSLRPTEPLPVAQELGETSLMLHVHPTLNEADMRRMGGVVRDVIQKATADVHCAPHIQYPSSEPLRRSA